MDTHYHLLFRTSEYPLSTVMRWLNSCYAQYYNDRYDRSGYLFQGRFKSIASQDQKYIEELVRYIHLNPIGGGVCRRLKQLDHYAWSGHAVLMGNRSNGFQDTEDVLRRFDKWHKRAQVRYRHFVRQGMGSRRSEHTLEHLRKRAGGPSSRQHSGSWVIGDLDFVREIIAKDKMNREKIARHSKEGITLNTI